MLGFVAKASRSAALSAIPRAVDASIYSFAPHSHIHIKHSAGRIYYHTTKEALQARRACRYRMKGVTRLFRALQSGPSHERSWRVPGRRQRRRPAFSFAGHIAAGSHTFARTDLPNTPGFLARHTTPVAGRYRFAQLGKRTLYTTQPAKTVQQMLESARRDWACPLRWVGGHQKACRVGCAVTVRGTGGRGRADGDGAPARPAVRYATHALRHWSGCGLSPPCMHRPSVDQHAARNSIKGLRGRGRTHQQTTPVDDS